MTDIIDSAMLEKERRKKRPAERSPSPGPQKRKPYSLRSHNPGRRPTTENGDLIIVIDDESPKKKRKTKTKIKNGPPNHSLKNDSETLHIVDSVMPQHSKSETPARDIIFENGDLLIVIDDDSPEKSEKKSEMKNESPKHTVKKDSETLKDMDSKPVNSVHQTTPYTFTKFVNKIESQNESQILIHKRKVLDILYKEVSLPGREYERVFDILRLMKGGVRVRCLIVRYMMQNARRLKKKLLIEMLDEFKLNLSQNTKLPW